MTRTHLVNGVPTPYTAEEEAEADAREAAWLAEQQPTAAKIIGSADRIAKEKRDMVTASISAAEMASWPIKRAEALAYQSSGSDTDAPNLAIEAAARGITLAALAGKVTTKAAQLSSLEAAIAGRCGAIQDAAAAAAASVAELEAIDLDAGWPV